MGGIADGVIGRAGAGDGGGGGGDDCWRQYQPFHAGDDDLYYAGNLAGGFVGGFGIGGVLLVLTLLINLVVVVVGGVGSRMMVEARLILEGQGLCLYRQSRAIVDRVDIRLDSAGLVRWWGRMVLARRRWCRCWRG